MSKVRAKFKCESVTETETNKQASLRVVTTGSEENKSFSKYTPFGQLQIAIDKDAPAAELFVPGKEYYLDFTEAGE